MTLAVDLAGRLPDQRSVGEDPKIVDLWDATPAPRRAARHGPDRSEARSPGGGPGSTTGRWTRATRSAVNDIWCRRDMAGWIPGTGQLSTAFIATIQRDIKGMTRGEEPHLVQPMARSDILTMESLLVINAKAKDIGGFPVRRALPAIERRMVGPFVFLDQMGPTRLAPGQRLDVRPHPHIGLSTMTYLFEGEILHRDSLGTVQMIQPGRDQLDDGRPRHRSFGANTGASAGSGAALSGIQFWVALPKSHEEMDPAFVHLEASELPVLADRNVSVRVIAGAAFGQARRSRAASDAVHGCRHVERCDMASSRRLSRAGPLCGERRDRAGWRQPYAGAVAGSSRPGISRRYRAVSDARLMLLGGEPMDGPRHIWWNFVSSSKDRIEQAKEDWKLGRFPRRSPAKRNSSRCLNRNLFLSSRRARSRVILDMRFLPSLVRHVRLVAVAVLARRAERLRRRGAAGSAELEREGERSHRDHRIWRTAPMRARRLDVYRPARTRSGARDGVLVRRLLAARRQGLLPVRRRIARPARLRRDSAGLSPGAGSSVPSLRRGCGIRGPLGARSCRGIRRRSRSDLCLRPFGRRPQCPDARSRPALSAMQSDWRRRILLAWSRWQVRPASRICAARGSRACFRAHSR